MLKTTSTPPFRITKVTADDQLLRAHRSAQNCLFRSLISLTVVGAGIRRRASPVTVGGSPAPDQEQRLARLITSSSARGVAAVRASWTGIPDARPSARSGISGPTHAAAGVEAGRAGALLPKLGIRRVNVGDATGGGIRNTPAFAEGAMLLLVAGAGNACSCITQPTQPVRHPFAVTRLHLPPHQLPMDTLVSSGVPSPFLLRWGLSSKIFVEIPSALAPALGPMRRIN